jgi:phosphotriesterase-related protein
MIISRRSFLFATFAAVASCTTRRPGVAVSVMSVNGPINASDLGICLIHEHILVDFGGAASYDPSSWDRSAVIEKTLPFLAEVKALGCTTFFDCTPNFLGRDVILLRELSKKSGLNIITNTGIYGGSDHKFLPAFAFEESAEELAKRWIDETNNGIDGTDIKPGFIKISVNNGPLSEMSRKLITAAALTHLKTGLTIASHTGKYAAASEQLDLLQRHGVGGDAFIWVHAQEESDHASYVKAAGRKCWISLDNVSEEYVEVYVEKLRFMREQDLLSHVLISHDAGWYDPDKKDSEFQPYTAIFTSLKQKLEAIGFTEKDFDLLLRDNPAKAFNSTVKTAKLN